MTSKHLDGLLKITVASRKKAVALNRVDVRKVGCQWVVAHKVLCSGRVHPMAPALCPQGHQINGHMPARLVDHGLPDLVS